MTKEYRLGVSHEGRHSYDIMIRNDFSRLGEEICQLGLDDRNVVIVTDSNVAPLYLEQIQDIFSTFSRQVFTFIMPAGEKSKNLDTVYALYALLVEKKLERKDYLVALGGGVVGDLCGYAAATYLRGVGFIQIPTTLLAQVDSSIGGKTGVDFSSYKNLVGAFHMPKLVYINICTLHTLPDVEFSSGMGEVIKHGLIRDHAYYEWISEQSEEILNRNEEICSYMVWKSAEIKRDIVQEDPYEEGIRKILNFGHTLGHAIEKELEFGLSHGACVGIGMLAAMKLMCCREAKWEKDYALFEDILLQFGLPVKLPQADLDQILLHTQNDKKMDSGTVSFILLRAIGDAIVDKTVSPKEMQQALRCLQMK